MIYESFHTEGGDKVIVRVQDSGYVLVAMDYENPALGVFVYGFAPGDFERLTKAFLRVDEQIKASA